MRISEIFYSIQGEGLFTGVPMIFIRLQGCPYRCTWCDSAYTWDAAAGQRQSLEQVLGVVAQWPATHVCITGGEPLAQPKDFLALAHALKHRGYWIEVETAGGIAIPREAPIDSWVVVVKCPGSSMERIIQLETLALLRPADQVKFVVASRADFDFALAVLRRHPTSAQTLFTPAWDRLAPEALVEWVKAEAPQARLSLQAHKYIWGPARRGV